MFYLIFVYGILILTGGVVGHAKASSQTSLITGLISGILLLLAAFGIYQRKKWAFPLALLTTLVLDLFFTYRFLLTKKFTPPGLLAIVSLIVLVALIRSVRRSSIK
jgi:uncharacterized membrane protein (UPF0136 family)